MDGKKHGSEDRKHREQRRAEEKRGGGKKDSIFFCFLGLTTFDQSRDLRSWTPSLKF